MDTVPPSLRILSLMPGPDQELCLLQTSTRKSIVIMSTSIFMLMNMIIPLSSRSRSLVHLNPLTLTSLASPQSHGLHCQEKGPDLAGS